MTRIALWSYQRSYSFAFTSIFIALIKMFMSSKLFIWRLSRRIVGMESAGKGATVYRKKPSRDWLKKNQWKSVMSAQSLTLSLRFATTAGQTLWKLYVEPLQWRSLCWRLYVQPCYWRLGYRFFLSPKWERVVFLAFVLAITTSSVLYSHFIGLGSSRMNVKIGTNFEQKWMLFACLTVFCNVILIER